MMKKSIFAVAVASVLTLGAAQAETVLYGSIRYDYESKKTEFGMEKDEAFINTDAKRLSNLSDAGSRIGIKGSEDLGNNNAVIYNLEWAFDGMENGEDGKGTAGGFKNRLAVLGLTGDWGTMTAGRQYNPFYNVIVDGTVVDSFNGSNVISSAAQRAMTTTLLGVDKYMSGKVAANAARFSRVGKVIAYTTPDFAGFQANAALMIDDGLYETNGEKNIDLWTINAKYAYDLGANGVIDAQAGYIQGKVADTNKSKAWGLRLGYSQEAFAVTAAYVDGNHKSTGDGVFAEGTKEKSKGWDLGASFSFGPNYFSSVRANYGENQLKVDGEKYKVKSWAVGFEQKLSTRTRAWVEYGQEKFHDNADKPKNNVVSVGMRHDF